MASNSSSAESKSGQKNVQLASVEWCILLLASLSQDVLVELSLVTVARSAFFSIIQFADFIHPSSVIRDASENSSRGNLIMVNSSSPWGKANVLINGVEWVPGSSGVMYFDKTNKVEVDAPEGSLQTLRFGVVDYGGPKPEAVPTWGTDIEREAGKFSSQVTFAGNLTGFLKLIIYSRDTPTVLEVPCEVKNNEPSLRFYYASSSQYAPLPPAVVKLRVNDWYSVDLKLTYSDGSPIPDAPAIIHRPQQNPVKGNTNVRGELIDFSAYRYTTPGLRTFEAVATLKSGEVRATYLINVES